jgi:hypothetical protein
MPNATRMPTRLHTADDQDLLVFHDHTYANRMTQSDMNSLCEEIEEALCRQSAMQRFIAEFNQHPNTFFYLSRFGLAQTRRLAEAACPAPGGERPQPDWTPGSRPMRAPDLQIVRLPQDAVAEVAGRIVIFLPADDKLIVAPSYVGRILASCDGTRPVADIASELGEDMLLGPGGLPLVLSTLKQLPTAMVSAIPGTPP